MQPFPPIVLLESDSRFPIEIEVTDHDDGSDSRETGEESVELGEDGVFLSRVPISIAADNYFWRDLRSELVS